MNDLVDDGSGGEILPAQKDSIVEAISSKDGKAPASNTKAPTGSSAKSKTKSGRGVAASDDTAIGRIAMLHEKQEAARDENGPPAKKTKMNKEDQDMVDLFDKYHKATNKQLTDILRYV